MGTCRDGSSGSLFITRANQQHRELFISLLVSEAFRCVVVINVKDDNAIKKTMFLFLLSLLLDTSAVRYATTDGLIILQDEKITGAASLVEGL